MLLFILCLFAAGPRRLLSLSGALYSNFIHSLGRGIKSKNIVSVLQHLVKRKMKYKMQEPELRHWR